MKLLRKTTHCLSVLALFLTGPATAMDECRGGNRAARALTCLVDGDTGWERGEKWRLLDIDTPETDRAECKAEYARGKEALARLRQLMAGGYGFEWDGRMDRSKRKLVRVILSDGRDAGQVLLDENLAQRWPNKGNVWCGR